jgi:hypothetical protein
MIKHTLPLLERLGFTSDCIYTTLENRMKCGLGKCGRCNTGKSFICIAVSREKAQVLPAVSQSLEWTSPTGGRRV